MNKTSKIYVAGHTGMVGSAIVRQLNKLGYKNIITRTRSQLDLTNQASVLDFFKLEAPEYVFIAAAKVGGIIANNTYRADFIYENIMIECNIINSAWLSNVTKLIFIGSSCIYPRDTSIPIKEHQLLTGSLENTNEPFAVAKIAGIKLCESYNRQYNTQFISLMSTSLYGVNDNYDPVNSHVIPALIRKAHEAKINGKDEIILWGTGTPMREFLFVDDFADACIFFMGCKEITGGLYNIGTGSDISIYNLALLISNVVGFKGKIYFDTSKPDGTFRKLLDVSDANKLGWHSSTSLNEGLAVSYGDFLDRVKSIYN